MSNNKRRPSHGSTKNRIKIMDQVLDKFISPEYLTKNSLFNNLYSSEDFKLEIPNSEFLSAIFAKESICSNELHEFDYFHKRDKKIILYHLILLFLQYGGKLQMLILQNNQKTDIEELKQFLVDQKNGGSLDMIEKFNKRVLIYNCSSSTIFKFQLQFLPLLLKQRQFLKMVVICDLNSYESSQKANFEKYYKKIPKELSIISFKRDFWETKFIQKQILSFVRDQNTPEVYQLNERVIHNLNKKYEGFRNFINVIAPIEYIISDLKTVEDTYKIALFRKSERSGRIIEITANPLPFKIHSIRQI